MRWRWVSRDPQHEINYAKEMVLARNNWELGIKSLKVANDELDAILKTCRYVIAAESQEAPPADPEAAAEMLSDRCRGLLIQAHHSIEQSERALYRLNEYGSFGKGHDISAHRGEGSGERSLPCPANPDDPRPDQAARQQIRPTGGKEPTAGTRNST